MNECDPLRTIRAGREDLPPGLHAPRHRHLHAYAIVALRGAFDQVGYGGRVRVSPGELLVQPTLDCHANRLCSAGAQILRLAWPHVDGLGGVYRLRDVDAVARAAERDLREAAAIAAAGCAAPRAAANDWPDLLAAELAAGAVASFGAWAERLGLARETVSRGFALAYGVPARRFRAELRTRGAWLRIVRTREPLAAIAAATGFADQAHMTRSVRALTGAPPAVWRRRGG